MSVIKQILTYPSTGRGFALPGNFMQNTAGALLTKKTFTVTEAQLEDDTYMFDSFEAGDLIPLHLVQSVIPQNEDIQKRTSQQDFEYETRPGKYKHTLRFDWDNAFHQIVETYSGTDLYIIHYDQVGHLILAEESAGIYRGVKTDGLILKKQELFGNGSAPLYSDLGIELKYDETFKVIQVDWLPEQIDKLFVTLDVTSLGVDYLNFTVKYNSTDIDTIEASDVSIVDDTNGEISGILLNNASGVYQATNFSETLTTGCLTVNATAYLGRVKYRVQIIVDVTVGFDLLDGDGFDLLDGTEFDLLEVTA
jgi:hypothetical protein